MLDIPTKSAGNNEEVRPLEPSNGRGRRSIGAAMMSLKVEKKAGYTMFEGITKKDEPLPLIHSRWKVSQRERSQFPALDPIPRVDRDDKGNRRPIPDPVT